MNQAINLRLPKKDRPKGLFLYCNSCKRHYSDHSKVKCRCGQLSYKALIHISGTRNNFKSQILDAKCYDEAIQQFFDFRQYLTANNYQKRSLKVVREIPERLVECFAYYIGFLNNVGVPKHKHKDRDPKYISKVDNAFEMYKAALDANDIDWKILKFTEVNDELVGFVHEYFLSVKEYANKTYNNNMGILSAFTSHVMNEFNLAYKNPFLGVPDLIVTPKVKSIRENEFEKLLEIVTPENGKSYKHREGRKNPQLDQLYKPWLKHAFKIGLYTGGRSEDIVELKWSDISLDEYGKLDTLRTIDYKIDNANSNRTGKDGRFEKYFAITQELGELLMEMGYQIYRGTDRYIIGTDENLKRTHVAALISRAFTHYYRQLNTGKAVTFKNLRKTFMTSALREFGEASTALTNHATISITNKHYYDKEITRDEARLTFSVFKRSSTQN